MFIRLGSKACQDKHSSFFRKFVTYGRKKFYDIDTRMELFSRDNYTSGLYYKHITIVTYDSSVVNKTDNTRGVIYDRNMFIKQAKAYITIVTISSVQF